MTTTESDVINYAKGFVRRRYDVLRVLGHDGVDLDVNVGKLGLDPAEARLFQAVIRLLTAEYADKLRKKTARSAKRGAR